MNDVLQKYYNQSNCVDPDCLFLGCFLSDDSLTIVFDRIVFTYNLSIAS